MTIANDIIIGYEPHHIVVLRDRKKAAEYSRDMHDQIIIRTLTGYL